MSVLILPFIPSNGNYEFSAPIEDVLYTFDVHWNETDSAWYFHITDDSGQPVARGLKIVCGTYIGRYYTHELFERGVFAAIDTEGRYRDPGFDDLGTRVLVNYYTATGWMNEIHSI